MKPMTTGLAWVLVAGAWFVGPAQSAKAAPVAPRTPANERAPQAAQTAPVEAPQTVDVLDLESVAREAGETRQLRDGITLRVSEGAVVQEGKATVLPLGPGGDAVPTTRLILERGRIDVIVPPPISDHPRRAVLIQAPDGRTGIVTGGHAAAAVLDWATVFAAIEGDMIVGNGSLLRPLPSGQRRTIRNDDHTDFHKYLPGRTTIRTRDRLHLALSGTSHARIQLDPAIRASRYRIWVLEKDGTELQTAAVQDVYAAGFVPLRIPHAGRFFVVARAIDSAGMEGPVSEPVVIRSVGVAPEGERLIDNGTVRLIGRQRVALAGYEGLDMRYGTSNQFVPAPGSLGLPNGRPTDVEFRDPDTGATVVLPLRPRTADADVHFTPARLTWPGPDLDIEVLLRDENGDPIRNMKGINATVTVNLETVELDWTREEGRMTASVPPPNGDGPWVVRVKVTDSSNHQIVRDFFEVAEAEPAKQASR